MNPFINSKKCSARGKRDTTTGYLEGVLPQTNARQLARIGDLLQVEAGDCVAWPGGRAPAAYVLLHGRVELTDANGSTDISAPWLLGNSAMLHGQWQVAANATQSSVLLDVDRRHRTELTASGRFFSAFCAEPPVSLVETADPPVARPSRPGVLAS